MQHLYRMESSMHRSQEDHRSANGSVADESHIGNPDAAKSARTGVLCDLLTARAFSWKFAGAA